MFLFSERCARLKSQKNPDARTPNKFGGSETHTEVSQTLECAARIGIRAARTILGGCPMNASLSKGNHSSGEHLGSERSPMWATRTRSSRYLPRRWHREPEGRTEFRALSDECRYPREHLGSEQKPRAGNAGTIHKTSSKMRHEHRKEEDTCIATSMLDTRVGSLKNLFGRRRSRVQAKQVKPQRDFSEETDHA